jgi:hypothetical protein
LTFNKGPDEAAAAVLAITKPANRMKAFTVSPILSPKPSIEEVSPISRYPAALPAQRPFAMLEMLTAERP